MRKSEKKFIKVCAITVVIGMLFAAYGNWLEKKVTREVTAEVTQQVETATHWETIKEAVLVSSNEDGYILSFEGEEYIYTFD